MGRYTETMGDDMITAIFVASLQDHHLSLLGVRQKHSICFQSSQQVVQPLLARSAIIEAIYSFAVVECKFSGFYNNCRGQFDSNWCLRSLFLRRTDVLEHLIVA